MDRFYKLDDIDRLIKEGRIILHDPYVLTNPAQGKGGIPTYLLMNGCQTTNGTGVNLIIPKDLIKNQQ